MPPPDIDRYQEFLLATCKVVPLREHKGRRLERRDRALGLSSVEPLRHRITRLLADTLELTGADRCALVWVDEYGPGLVHTRAVVDLATDRPRRGASLELLGRAWRAGVPGVVDVTEERRIVGPGTTARSALAVSLGSDGLRAWFLTVDSASPRGRLEDDVVERVMYIAGECSSVVLHPDLVEEGEDPDAPRFRGWAVLRDLEEEGVDDADQHRISWRFLVVRALRGLLEDDLAVDRESVDEQVKNIRREIGTAAGEDAERAVWFDIMNAMTAGDWPELCRRTLALGELVDRMGHWHGAREAFEATLELAVATRSVSEAIAAARGIGRSWRRLGRWEEASRGYETAAALARTFGDLDAEIDALNGAIAVCVSRGDIPGAKEKLAEVEARLSREVAADARATVHQQRAFIAHTEGRLEDAARHAWEAVATFEDSARRLEALTSLGGIFLEGRALDAAERAFRAVERGEPGKVYRLYALAGLSEVAAYRGDRGDFERGVARVREAGLDAAPPEVRAEVLLEWGDCYLYLGDDDEAARHYERAIEVAERTGVGEYLIRAERALDRLRKLRTKEARRAGAAPPAGSLELAEEELERIRGGLATLAGGSVGPV